MVELTSCCKPSKELLKLLRKASKYARKYEKTLLEYQVYICDNGDISEDISCELAEKGRTICTIHTHPSRYNPSPSANDIAYHLSEEINCFWICSAISDKTVRCCCFEASDDQIRKAQEIERKIYKKLRKESEEYGYPFRWSDYFYYIKELANPYTLKYCRDFRV